MIKTSEYRDAKSTWLPWLMFGIAALFYCFVYFLRVSPGMMTTEVQKHFAITATKFGLFTSLYYAAYSPMQLVVGTIIDRYGARAVLFGACLICLAGVYLFGTAHSFAIACAGRFLMGLGTSFGYVTILKVASLWLPPKRFAAAAGLTTAFGMVAAIVTEKYLATTIQQSGFHNWLMTSLTVGTILAFVFMTVLRNSPSDKGDDDAQSRLSFKELKEGYWKIITNPQCWYIGIVGALLYMPAMVFLDVSGPSYFHAAYGLNKSESATMVNLIFAGWIVGGPAIGMISDHIKRRKSPLMISSFVAMLLISAIFYLHLPMPVLMTCMVLLGFTCGAHPLVFSLGKENSPLRMSGTATAFTNFLVMAGGYSLSLYGKLLDTHWDGTMLNGAPLYSLADYRFALTLIPIGLAIAMVISGLIKETHARTWAENNPEEAASMGLEPKKTEEAAAVA